MITVTLNLGDTPLDRDHAHRNEAQLIVSMLRETAAEFFTPYAAEVARRIADEVEAQMPKPKPSEPVRLGSVIRVNDTWLSVRVGRNPDRPWVSTVPDMLDQSYDEFHTVEVLPSVVNA